MTDTELKVYWKYIGKLTWLVSKTWLDLAIYVMESVRQQKNTTLKDLRNINRILEKVAEKENEMVFGRVADRDDMFVMGVSVGNYYQEESSVAK